VTATIDPPYLRIVAEIRRRIADGELVPGDRVPSTRQIAADWHVALATAAKALATLRQEGVVSAQPRVGTVVAAPTPGARTGAPTGQAPVRPPRTPTTEPDHELTRQRVVRAAVEIADTEGLSALSMRGVAARLGVGTMSPYRYVSSKDELVLLMADSAYGEESYPSQFPPGWRPRLELAARRLWRLYRRHPWLAQIGSLNRPLPLHNLMVHAEWVLAALDGHGLDPTTMLELHILVYSHVQGIAANLERERDALAITGMTEDQWMDEQTPRLVAIADVGNHPTFTKVMATFAADGYDLDLDALFELGLRALLDGMALIIGQPA
jgi:AcrR family transcriptional regulator